MMRVTLAEQFKEAFAKAGKEIPSVEKLDVARKPHPQHKRSDSQHGHRDGKGVSGSQEKFQAPAKSPSRATPVSKKQDAVKRKKQRSSKSQTMAPRGKKTPGAFQPLDYDVYRRGMTPSKPNALPLASACDPEGRYGVSLLPSSRPNWESRIDTTAPPLLTFALTGQEVQCRPKANCDLAVERELVLGLDFGTSTVKAVVGDSALGREGVSFAVPFRKDPGVAGYLLPCRLYQQEEIFSLRAGDEVHSDLKLDLLANAESSECRRRVVAFLALVIRQTRAWLFTQHASVYSSSQIIWKLCVGLPSESHFTPEEAPLFERLVRSAWILAGDPASELHISSVDNALIRAEQLQNGETPVNHEDVEVSVVPEIAAQIYGYVASEQFDPNAPNDFMMVDVGAGTVDVSLFHVKSGRGGKWDFEFYTTVVKPYGAINLHRRRLDWWQAAIQKNYPEMRGLASAVADARKVSDIQSGLPASMEDYFTNADVVFTKPDQHIDTIFFKQVFGHVFHDGYWKASTGHLTRNELNNIPVYLCGGGSRHPLFQRLTQANGHHSFYSWMKVSFRTLSKPSNLDAPGLSHLEFDRLSVAYGLSFLDVGKVVKAIPCPQPRSVASDTWRENYIDK
jgi:hypothetical protein